jgi:flagellar hook-basal body complex protein FliE
MLDQISSVASAVSRPGQVGAPAFMDAVQNVKPAAGVPDDFSGMLTRMISDTAQALHKAEANSIGAVQGQVPIQQVVETVMHAEQMLQAAIAVRDKVTAAYLELSRMAI